MSEHREDLGTGVFHLISSHEVAPVTWDLHPVYFAVCGAQVETDSLEDTECPNECECEFLGRMAYCPACVRSAVEANRRAGVDTEGAAVVDGRHGGGLDLGDEVLLLILTRVREGRIWRHYREYLDDGRHVWAHVAWALEGMLECDHLRLGEVGPDGSQRVDLAERGLANYTRLGRRLVGARDEADEPRGCIIVGCGCRRTVWASGRVDECTCDGGSPGGAS